jgi:3-deoxy-manno-octulosonate cytidylyltransferase (CMP-KDO synthetase)
LAAGSRAEVVAAVPARWGSTRLPGKPLLPLGGKPMVQHVYERAARAPGVSRVVVLTDDERIAAAVAGFGGACELTPAECASGTDRIAWAARGWSAEAVVNVQGDEPLIDPQVIGRVALHLREQPADPMVTLAVPAAAADLDNPNAVKVVVDRRGYALYFSRAPIPWPRQAEGAAPLRHLGLYGYQRQTLLALAALPPSPLEVRESLEQLRALEHGVRLRVLLVEQAAAGVDTAEDAARVAPLLGGGAAS